VKPANADMVARLVASSRPRVVTTADVLAQVQAAPKSVATSALPRTARNRQVRCECGLWRDEALTVHSPHAKGGFIVDCMGRVLR
jgi:hypothetical protein